MSEVRGSGQKCKAATVQEQPRGATSRPRPGVVAEISNPTPKKRWLHWQNQKEPIGQPSSPGSKGGPQLCSLEIGRAHV